MQLEDLQQTSFLIRGRDDREVAALVIEQQTGRRHAEQVDAGIDQLVQEIDDVVVIDEGVRKDHESLREQLLAISVRGRFPGHIAFTH